MKRPCLPGDDHCAKKPRMSDPLPPWPGHDRSPLLTQTNETLVDSFNVADWEVIDAHVDEFGRRWQKWRHVRDNWSWWWDGTQWWDGAQ